MTGRVDRRRAGIAIADRVAMLESRGTSISPEGCSGILWKGNANAAEAADAELRARTSPVRVIDHVVRTPSAAPTAPALGGQPRQYIAKTSAI